LNVEVLEFANSFLISILVSSAFLLGAFLSIIIRYPERIRADLSAFSAGIFLSTIAFSLVDDSINEGSFATMAIGFGIGAITFSIMNRLLLRIAKTKKNREVNSPKSIESNNKNRNSSSSDSSSKIVVIGTFLDSFPESIFIGVIIALNIEGLLAAALALFIGNLTATMEGAKRMMDEKKHGYKILKQWFYIFIIVAIGGPIGWYLEIPFTPGQLSIVIGFAAGALMAFITEELIPQAYKRAELHIGLSSSFGFLVGLALFHFL
jgi:ZIP family zinc transporter